MSLAAKRAQIAQELRTAPSLSNRKVARYLGVNRYTVADHRSLMVARGEIADVDTSVADYLRLPAFPDALVHVSTLSDTAVSLVYVGCRADLIVADVCTAEMFEWKPRGGHNSRFDADGEKFTCTRYVIHRKGLPIERYRVKRHKSRVHAERLPGAAAAISAACARERLWQAQLAEVRS